MIEQHDKTLDTALWRYGIISPFLHRDANDLAFGKMLQTASLQKYVHPNGSHITHTFSDRLACQSPG